mmetsp:Transcript_947/g.1159  ORF Transcript_947/g.1159 Transcript_947/m.1159 type:complete len:343 (-) Transcript_947:933-1961(-)
MDNSNEYVDETLTPILANENPHNFSSLDTNIRRVDLPSSGAAFESIPAASNTIPFRRSNSVGVVDNDTANVRLNALENGRIQANDTAIRYHARAITFICMPQIIAICVILAWKWRTEACDANLRVWAIVHGLRQLGSLYLTWNIKWESDRNSGQTSERLEYMERLRTLFDHFGVVWLILGNFWIYQAADTCINSAPTIYYLCAVLIYFGFFIMFLPCIMLMLVVPCIIFCLPCLLRVLTRLALVAEGPQGASEAEINKIPMETYQQGMFSADESQCSICLTGYEPEESIRLLPCDKRHHFHSKCVDEWLRMNRTCPICRAPLYESEEEEELQRLEEGAIQQT